VLKKGEYTQLKNINIYHEKKGVKYISFAPLDEKGVINAFSTRIGGKSREPYNTLNMGLHTGDDCQNVIENRKLFLDRQGLNLSNAVAAKQVHSTNLQVVDDSLRGKGAWKWEDALDDTDGLITNSKNTILITFYADCVPIYIYDSEKEIVALAHAGWKGTVGKIAWLTLQKMKSHYGTKTSQCLVVIGPSIGPCCYEVDENLVVRFKNAGFNINKLAKNNRPEHYLLNLWEANKEVVLQSGVPEDNVFVSGLCTSCNNDIFFSYRAENGITGRMAAIIALNKGEMTDDGDKS
jgi:hypothetical protein